MATPSARADAIQVACAANARFAPDCAVMLASLMNTNPPEAVHVHLLHDESLPDTDRQSLGTIVTEAGGTFEAIGRIRERIGALAQSERFPLDIWYRVVLPELLADLPRVLYLDADALVESPLRPLWETDLDGHLIGAVTNPLYASMVPRIQTELGLPDASSYFNSGMLLIDLDAWRQAGTAAEILSFAEQHPGLIWPDQDALNAVLHGRRLHLHPRWNAMPGLWELPRRYLPYTQAETREAVAAPAIVHFVGPHKPWHYRSRHPYRSEFFRYLEQTPWRGRPIEGQSPWQAVLRRLPAHWAYRVEVAVDRWPRQARASWWRLRAAVGRMR
jgi:lipopolysaccharide biosynthesis glycosyltransferase